MSAAKKPSLKPSTAQKEEEPLLDKKPEPSELPVVLEIDGQGFNQEQADAIEAYVQGRETVEFVGVNNLFNALRESIETNVEDSEDRGAFLRQVGVLQTTALSRNWG